MWAIWILVFGLRGAGAHADAMERFHALSRTKTLSEFERTRRKFDLIEAATLACRKELDSGRVPASCYIVMKIDGEKDTRLRREVRLSAADLAKVTRQAREKERLRLYKLGKDLE
jgi:hypothetical protein